MIFRISKGVEARAGLHKTDLFRGLLGLTSPRGDTQNYGKSDVKANLAAHKISGDLAHYPARNFWGKFLSKAIKVGSDQSFSSIRHSVRDALRRIEAPGEALWAICGWSEPAKAMSGNNGDPGNPDHYEKWVGGIAYKDLDLSFLYGSEA